jgi:hypothetical protein
MVVVGIGSEEAPASVSRHPRRRVLLSGTLAGTAASIGFAGLHHLLISDIWFSLLPMMLAGAACGLCLAWSYRAVFPTPSPTRWILYNLEFAGLFVLLGAVSFLIYEPVYTISGLVAGVESPNALVAEATPLIAGFALLAGAGLALLRGRTPAQGISIVVTCVVLTVLLGHNAAILGMVHLTGEAVPLLAEFYALLAAIMLGNALLFLVLERRGLFGPGTAPGGE